MTELDLGSDETPLTPTDRLHQSLVEFTGCIGNALDDMCSFGLTMGESYVPFDPDPDEDCDENDVACSQAWVRVMNANPKAGSDVGFGGQDCALALIMTLEVGVIRCIEIPEDGEAPTTTDVLIAALQATTDMNAVLCAALACETWDSIEVGTWSPMGPLGGQHGGTWTFTVEL